METTTQNQKFTKISEKLYSIRIDGQLRDIDVPFQKAKLLFESFLQEGGLINEKGEVVNDIVQLITQFGRTGDLVLTKFGPKGAVLEEGDCSELSVADTIALFELASDVVTSFIQQLSETRKANETLQVEEGPKSRKKN